MSTGYTSEIAKGISFKKFAFNCARQFGACVTMRDDNFDTPIPKEFKPSDYHQKEIEKARRKLHKIENMSIEKCSIKARIDYDEEVKEDKKDNQGKEELKKKYESMLKKVFAWKSPSKDHNGLKKFMIAQIEDSIRFDCNVALTDKPKLFNGKEWKVKELQLCSQDIDYHTEEHDEEVTRVNGRNLWIKQLRDSFGKGG